MSIEPIPQRVAGQSEAERGLRDVPAALLERVEQARPLDVEHRVAEHRLPIVARDGASCRVRREPERRGPDRLPVGEQDHTLHHVSQLAHVPRPVVCEQRRTRLRGQRLGGESVVLARAREEVLGEEDDVFAALAERRQAQGEDRQPMIQILAESPGPHGVVQVLASGGDDPDVDGLAPGAAETPDLVVLDDLQELRLERAREQADLVQEDRAAARGLEQAGLGLTRAGEGAALPTEQLGLEQRLGNRRTVDVDERPAGTDTGAVDRRRDQSLAGSGLSEKKNGR